MTGGYVAHCRAHRKFSINCSSGGDDDDDNGDDDGFYYYVSRHLVTYSGKYSIGLKIM